MELLFAAISIPHLLQECKGQVFKVVSEQYDQLLTDMSGKLVQDFIDPCINWNDLSDSLPSICEETSKCGFVADSLESLIRFSQDNPNRWREISLGHCVTVSVAKIPSESEFGSVPLNIATFLFVETPEGRTFEVFRDHISESKGRVVVQKVCDGGTRNKCDPLDRVWNRRKNLTGVSLRTVSESLPPLSLGGPGLNGIFPKVFGELQKILGFSYVVLPSVDGTWGNLLPESNGSLSTHSGMVGMLERSEVDMSICPIAILNTRAGAIDFSSPFYFSHKKLFVRTDISYEFSIFQMIRVYRSDMWTALLISCPVLMVAMAVHFSRDGIQGVQGVSVVLRAMVLLGGTCCCLPKNSSGRVLYVATFALGFVTFSCYKALVLAHLTVKEPFEPITSLDDVLALPDIVIGSAPNGSTQNYFETAPKGSVEHRIWTEKMAPMFSSAMTRDKGWDKLLSMDNYVYVGNPEDGKSRKQYPCGFHEVGERFFTRAFGFGFQKGSPLKALLDFHLGKLVEVGIVDRIIREEIDNREKALEECGRDAAEEYDDNSRLRFGSTVGIFLILIGGVIICGLGAMVEWVFRAYNQNACSAQAISPKNK